MAGSDLIGDLAVPFVAILPRGRSIGSIIPNATIRELARDEVTVVDQPVQTGSTVSDHAFRMPSYLQMEVAWSCCGESADYDIEVYNELLSYQRNRTLLPVATGKRSYTNMILSNLMMTNTQQTENALFLTCDLRELILVNIQQGGGGANSSASAPSDDPSEQASPQSTLGTVDSGGGTAFSSPYSGGSGDGSVGTINSGNGGAFAQPYSGSAPPLGSSSFSAPVDASQFQTIQGDATFGVQGIDSQYDYTPSFVTPDTTNEAAPLTVTR